MVLFKTPSQLFLIPAIGFIKDGNVIRLNISWLIYGLCIDLFTINND